MNWQNVRKLFNELTTQFNFNFNYTHKLYLTEPTILTIRCFRVIIFTIHANVCIFTQVTLTVRPTHS